MRLLRFGLHAFGPFSETELDLSGPARGGLHVIFGLNEAGKSTALRAVSALLFGMGERTLDAHSHPARDLKLGAVIEEGQRQLAFVRRKRRKDSLRTPGDEPLSEAELAPFLHGVDATVFHSLFGLDHERLKLGGQALLNGQGDIGESLFDAGTGGGGIHGVLSDLGRECDALFKVRASKPSLNAAVGEYKAAKKKSRDEVRVPEKYLEQLGAVERAKAQRQALALERAALREQQERVERVLGTQPLVLRRQQCRSELGSLGQVPHLPEDVTTERREVQQLLLECARDIERSEREIQRRRGEIGALPAETELCELAKHTFDELRDKVGIHRKAARDLPNVRGQIKQAETDALRILVRMGKPADLEAAEALRLDTARIAKIRRLARERAVLFPRQESARERLAQVEQELAEKRRALQACGPEVDTFGLAGALRDARGLGPAQQKLSEIEQALAAEQRRLEELARKLFLEARGAGFNDLADTTAPPEVEVIESFEVELAKLEAAREQLDSEFEHALREQAEAERHIRTI
ncbi:MAG TPA: AAA family ATPase, partial [Polyangiaceae bacterium]